MTFGTFVKTRMRVHCPALRANNIVFAPFMSKSGPDGVLWVVSVHYNRAQPPECASTGAFEYARTPIAGIRSDDGVVQAMADQHSEADRRSDTWLSDFGRGRAP